jgi:CBS domain-containing protein
VSSPFARTDVPALTVRAAMIRHPKTMPASATLAEARSVLGDSHVHLLLLVDDGRLVGTIDRDDLAGVRADDATPATAYATLAGRTTGPDADAEALRHALRDASARRLAVVDDEGRLLGLLCLKRSGQGYCSDVDVADRAADPTR